MISRIQNSIKYRKFTKKWRIINGHNSTFLSLIPNSDEFFNRVKVGKKTYGPIWAVYSENPEESLSIGHFCSIASGTKFILGSEHPYSYLSTFPFKVKCAKYEYEATTKGPIVVGDDVWIGEDSLILSGVNIGQGAVIAARSVVVKNVQPYTIVGGNPAKELKKRFSNEIINVLVNFNFNQLYESLIKENIDSLYSKITENNIHDIISKINGSK